MNKEPLTPEGCAKHLAQLQRDYLAVRESCRNRLAVYTIYSQDERLVWVYDMCFAGLVCHSDKIGTFPYVWFGSCAALIHDPDGYEPVGADYELGMSGQQEYFPLRKREWRVRYGGDGYRFSPDIVSGYCEKHSLGRSEIEPRIAKAMGKAAKFVRCQFTFPDRRLFRRKLSVVCSRPILLGSARECDVRFRDRSVAGKHALIFVEMDCGDRHVSIADYTGRCGLAVNGEPVPFRKRIYVGDEIQLGSSRLIFNQADMVPVYTNGEALDCLRDIF